MISHVVLFQLHDPADAAEVRDQLASLRGRVSQVRSMVVGAAVGPPGSPWHVALNTTHDSWDDLAAYRDAPAHRDVLKWLESRVADRAAVDFES